MANLEERAGYVGNLDEKTKPELLELLDRQEALLQNRPFINKLPDQGRKIEKFADILRKFINKKYDIEDAVDQLQNLTIQVEDDPEEVAKINPDRANLMVLADTHSRQAKIISKDTQTIHSHTKMKEKFKPYKTLKTDINEVSESVPKFLSELKLNGGCSSKNLNSGDASGDVQMEDFIIPCFSKGDLKIYEQYLPSAKQEPIKNYVKFDSKTSYCFITYDILTNGVTPQDSEISQVAASCGDATFHRYITPPYISNRMTSLVGYKIEYKNAARMLTRHGEIIESSPKHVVLKKFNQFIDSVVFKEKEKSGNDVTAVLISNNPNVSISNMLLMNYRVANVRLPNVCFAESANLFNYLKDNGKITDTSFLKLYKSHFDIKLDPGDCLQRSNGLHRILFKSALELPRSDIINHSLCKSHEMAQHELEFSIWKNRLVNSMRGKLFDFSLSSRNVITPEIVSKISEAGLGYEDLEKLYKVSTNCLIAIFALPASSSTDTSPRITNDVSVLKDIVNHFRKRLSPVHPPDGIIQEGIPGKSITKQVTLTESFQLLQERKNRVEELQSKQAADRLTKQFDIKMSRFDPESSKSELRYRDQVQDADDSDDADDIDYPE